MVKPGYERVGRRIKEERLRCGLTLTALAQAVAVSASYISLLENGKAVPSLKILDRICTRLSIHLSMLFSEEEAGASKGYSIFRQESHILLNISDRRQLRVLLPKTGLPLEPVQLVIQPGDEHTSFSAHKGVEFGYVIRGEVDFTVKERGRSPCRAGDSLVYDAMLPHSFINSGESEAELLLVGMPNLVLGDGF